MLQKLWFIEMAIMLDYLSRFPIVNKACILSFYDYFVENWSTSEPPTRLSLYLLLSD